MRAYAASIAFLASLGFSLAFAAPNGSAGAGGAPNAAPNAHNAPNAAPNAQNAPGVPNVDVEAEKARRATVLAHVGPRVITVGELEERLATVPRYQLATFGPTPDAIRRKFLDDVIVQETLLALGAEDKHLDTELPAEYQLERARSNATLRHVRSELGPATAITMDEVKAYYEANRSRYDSPERINLWRILCKTREEAVVVLEASKREATIANFTTLAREHSIDKATYMRGGNLGFLSPDGTSNEAGLKVDAAVVKAAQPMKDGELVSAPVQEGPYFAVVWRRGTVGASHRTAPEVAAQIRDTIWKEKREQAEKKEIDDLRARDLHDLNEAPINTIEIATTDGSIGPRRRPGQVPPLTNVARPGSSSPPPSPTPPPIPGK